MTQNGFLKYVLTIYDYYLCDVKYHDDSIPIQVDAAVDMRDGSQFTFAVLDLDLWKTRNFGFFRPNHWQTSDYVSL